MERVFGYGSLIWKPPPHTIARQPGYIKGFTRRFAQRSHDHRGTPEAPGRVVTLVPSDEWQSLPGADAFQATFVWGVVYTIHPAHAVEVKAYLDHREKDGYELVRDVDVFQARPDGKEALLTQADVYVGHIDNPSFAGPMPLPDLAAHIHKCSGPSGPNKEYLYHLNDQIQVLNPGRVDDYLAALTALVRQLDAA